LSQAHDSDFKRPFKLKRSGEIASLADARDHYLAMSDGRGNSGYWAHAMELVILPASGGSITNAEEQLHGRFASTAKSRRDSPDGRSPRGYGVAGTS
jgi:hypothetical protein